MLSNFGKWFEKKEPDSRFAHFRYQVTAKAGESDIRDGEVSFGCPTRHPKTKLACPLGVVHDT